MIITELGSAERVAIDFPHALNSAYYTKIKIFVTTRVFETMLLTLNRLYLRQSVELCSLDDMRQELPIA